MNRKQQKYEMQKEEERVRDRLNDNAYLASLAFYYGNNAESSGWRMVGVLAYALLQARGLVPEEVEYIAQNRGFAAVYRGKTFVRYKDEVG